MIIEQTYNLLKTRYRDRISGLSITDVRIGQSFTALKLSDNSYGISATFEDTSSGCDKNSRDFGIFTPLRIKGQNVSDLFETDKETGIILTLKVAALNAISSVLISENNYKIINNCDPIDLIDLSGAKKITIVGAFQSYIRKLSATKHKLHILELDVNKLADDHKKYFIPAEDYRKVIPDSDIIIITGLTLVNKTIDQLLSSADEKSQIIVTGPSSSIIPDVLFMNKVDIVGSIRITDPVKLIDCISEAGAGYHLYHYGCAEKICILKRK
jgi:uncharacterized protein